jgi:uncharacterized membrane protein YphA (DoxX/SURF4 family)
MRRALILLLVVGVVLLVAGLAWWSYLVSACSNAFSSDATLSYCRGYYTNTQLITGGLANSVPLMVELVIVLGSILTTVGIVLLVGTWTRHKK